MNLRPYQARAVESVSAQHRHTSADLRARELHLLDRLDASPGDPDIAAELLQVQQSRLEALRRERADLSVWASGARGAR